MERAVNVLGDCGEAPRNGSHPLGRPSGTAAAAAIVWPVLFALCALFAPGAAAQTTDPSPPDGGVKRPGPQRPSKPVVVSVASDRSKLDAPPPPSPAPPAAPATLADTDSSSAPRFKVRDKLGQCVVARLHGQNGDKPALILPDGQLGTANLLVPTDDPFRPFTAAELADQLHENKGEFADYPLLKTEHYLIFYKSTRAFAEDSGRLLEDLYRGLISAFERNNLPVHESEFPLVAVIFATEADFRAHKLVDRQVRAYYEYYTNRIFFFQKSDRDAIEPKVAALLKPQTVAHEGAHQILSNIGVQPRPSYWPLWLVEGLAEYCATTVVTKKGINWSGLGAINSLHMATIRELEDPLSNIKRISRKDSAPPSETLLLKSALSPTDYADAWALTHYLAQKRFPEFMKYLKAMSQVPPFEQHTPAENLAEFRKYFSEPPAKLEKKLSEHIHKISQKRGYDSLFFYAVVFEQPLANGLLRRAATFSQSPQIIQEWVQEMTSPTGGLPSWEATTWPTRATAEKAVQDWMRGN